MATKPRGTSLLLGTSLKKGRVRWPAQKQMLSPAALTRRSTSSRLHPHPRAKEKTRAIGKEEHNIPKQKAINNYFKVNFDRLSHNLETMSDINTFILALSPLDVCQCQTKTTPNIPATRKNVKRKGTQCHSSFARSECIRTAWCGQQGASKC